MTAFRTPGAKCRQLLRAALGLPMHSGKVTNLHIALAFIIALVLTSRTDAQATGSQSQQPPAGAGAQLSHGAAAPDPAAIASQSGGGGGASANGGGVATPSTAGSGAAQPTPRIPQPEVVDAYREGKHSLAFDEEGRRFRSVKETREECNKDASRDECLDRRTARLNDIVYVKVANLEPLLKRAKCLDVGTDGKTTAPKANCQAQNILLFLNGRAIKGLFPESGAPSIEPDGDGTLRYHLKRYDGTSATAKAESDEHWADLLGLDPGGSQWGLVRDQVTVSVGLENEYPIPSTVTNFRLRRMRGRFLVAFLFLAAALLYILMRLAKESGVLRDRKPVSWRESQPYSLSATQAAWWFVLTIMSFVFIWAVTGEYDLSASVLVLLGIGFGTALGATVIDHGKSATPAAGVSSTAADLETLLARKGRQEQELEQLSALHGSESPELEAAKVTYDETLAEIRHKYPNAIGPGHTTFSLDVLSDDNGVNFHRFQMAVWTVVLGFVFIYSVLSRLAMPKFSDTLLTLMGISAGTYLGFKIPENTVAPPSPAAPNPPARNSGDPATANAPAGKPKADNAG